MSNQRFFRLLLVLGCFVAAAYQLYQNRSLPSPQIDLNTNRVSYAGMTIVSFDGPPANKGELVVTLKPGQVAEIDVLFETTGEVVVTTDPVQEKGLSMDFMDPLTRNLLGAEANPQGNFSYTKEEYGHLYVYVAAKGLGETRFSVRHDDSIIQQEVLPIQP